MELKDLINILRSLKVKTIKMSMPLYVQLGKTKKAKKYHINLNNYRNYFRHVSNNVKKKYQDIAIEVVEDSEFFQANRVELKYILYRGDKRKVDLANVLSLHDKFFSDAMVWLQVIPDDSTDHIEKVVYKYGGIDRDNPRVDIEIKILEER